MSWAGIHSIREQILANARFMFQNPKTPIISSSNTLVPESVGCLHVIVFGEEAQFRGAVMIGSQPAIESAPSPTPELALRRLLLATTEVIGLYVPGMGAHSRNIHGGAGGMFDEDLIAPRLSETLGKDVNGSPNSRKIWV